MEFDSIQPNELSVPEWIERLMQQLIADEGDTILVVHTDSELGEQYHVLEIKAAGVLTPEQFRELQQSGESDAADQATNPVLG